MKPICEQASLETESPGSNISRPVSQGADRPECSADRPVRQIAPAAIDRDRPKGTGPVSFGFGPLHENVSGPDVDRDNDLTLLEPQVISQFPLMAKHGVQAGFRSNPVLFPQKSVRT